MLRRAFFPILLATSCAGGATEGTWSGDCALSADGRSLDHTVSMNLERDGKTSDGSPSLTGPLEIADQSVEYTVRVDTYEDGSAMLSAAGTDPEAAEDNSSVFYLTLEGTLEGDSLEGEADYWTELNGESSRRYQGSCSFTRE